MLLVMGFTGKAALQIKIKYTKAFDWMAEQLQKSKISTFKQFNEWSLMEKHSKFKGSVGSGLMHDRKREKKIIESEYQKLIENSQIKMIYL